MRYSIITRFHPTFSCLLELTSDFISSREGVHFEASWMLVARWVEVCPYGDNRCTEVSGGVNEWYIFCAKTSSCLQIQENNFQAVVVTNGILSYTVFTYQCGELNWVQRNNASIGFSISTTSFANHSLSRLPNINDIACLSQQCPPWTNVVYQIGRKLGDNLHAH